MHQYETCLRSHTLIDALPQLSVVAHLVFGLPLVFLPLGSIFPFILHNNLYLLWRVMELASGLQ